MMFQMNVNKISHGGLHAQMHIDEDKTKSPSSVQVRKTTKYSLLMENLDILEQIFADSNVVRLESHILEQLGRLGALNLFHACLSRTLRTPSEFEISQVVVRSGKKEERRSRRERALRKADKISTLSLPSKVTRRKPKQNTFSSAKRPRNTRSRRLAIARNEEELSRGVKVVLLIYFLLSCLKNVFKLGRLLLQFTSGGITLLPWHVHTSSFYGSQLVN